MLEYCSGLPVCVAPKLLVQILIVVELVSKRCFALNPVHNVTIHCNRHFKLDVWRLVVASGAQVPLICITTNIYCIHCV